MRLKFTGVTGKVIQIMNDIYFSVGYAYRQHYAIKDEKTGKLQQGYTLHAVIHKHDNTGDIIRSHDCKCNPVMRDKLIEAIKAHTEFELCLYDEFGRLCSLQRRDKK